MTEVDPGLCQRCARAKRVQTARGSSFWQCTHSQVDPAYPKYPRLPVTTCPAAQLGDGDSPGHR